MDNNGKDFFSQPIKLWHLLAALVYITFLFIQLEITIVVASVILLFYIGQTNSPYIHGKKRKD